MPSFDNDPAYGTTTAKYLSTGPTHAPRKSPSRQSLSINARRSTASLRGSSLAQTLDDDAANGRHSLAHELAVALMPEPSAGSKLLAEEFGIEYDEGAEGIDAGPEKGDESPERSPSYHDPVESDTIDSLSSHPSPAFASEVPLDVDPVFSSAPPVSPPPRKPEQDPMVILAQDLEYTEKFLTQLRRLDTEHGSTAQPRLEQVASDVIRRLNDTVRDREGQVRELLEYEREFRRIASEVGGNDALGLLEEIENLIETAPSEESRQEAPPTDEPADETLANTTLANDWEVDPDQAVLEDEDDEYGMADVQSPVKATFPPPPPLRGPPTPASTLPQLADLRTFTSSTASSLATISEHTQVNAAATTEAGRKIRALKNKLGGWRTEWDSAERSRVKIEKWEAGLDVDSIGAAPPPSSSARRIDGRKLVQEHLQAFEKALAEANVKTQAIMAAAS